MSRQKLLDDIHREFRREAVDHLLRDVPTECWCQREAQVIDYPLFQPLILQTRPAMIQRTVIELHVAGQFDDTAIRQKFAVANLPVFYTNEEGLCYMRRTMTNVNVKLYDIAQMIEGYCCGAAVGE